MTKREQQWYHSLLGIRNEFQTVVNDIKRNDMIVNTKVLDLIDQINKLASSLKQINIKYIKENYDNTNLRLITLTGLYMAVIYIVVKNLVRINSYYSFSSNFCISFCSILLHL